MELGGVLAVANMRGGGEYGEDWHQAGKTLKKQNVFDDFIGAAEWLIAEGRTTTEQARDHGRQQRRAVGWGRRSSAARPVRRLHSDRRRSRYAPLSGVHRRAVLARRVRLHRKGRSSSKRCYAYSPYHNIKKGTKYPPTLIMTADTDDRVVPMHSFKFAAALQRAQAGDAPILLRIESKAGHGHGTPVTKLIDNAADRWAFLVKELGMPAVLER